VDALTAPPMLKLATKTPTLLLAGGFVAFAALAYLQGQGPGAPDPGWTSVATAATAPEPSADNVDPGFHARLMTLRGRLAKAPDDAAALLEAARLEQDAHQLEQAAEHYERYLALDPDEHQAWLDLANVYAGLARWDDARDASERMLERFPDDPSARYNLGAIAANQGDADAARRHWESVRGGPDPALAAQAEASLAQLDGMASARPARSARPTAARPSPHAALGQPVVARRVGVLDGAE
jgi:tetratricopeptide (TPR) repeat protein